MHQEDRATHALLPQPIREPAEVGFHQRLDIGVGDDGVEALVFAHLRRDFARQRHHDFGQPFRQNLSHHTFMNGVEVGMNEPDGDAGVAAFADRLSERLDLFAVHRDQSLAARIDAFAQRVAKLTRQKRFRQRQIEVILLEARFRPHLDDVAKTFGRDERGLGSAPLDQRVGRQGGAVNDLVNRGRRNASLGADQPHPLDDGVLRRGIGRQHLGGELARAVLDHHVREGAADVDAKTNSRSSHRRNTRLSAGISGRLAIPDHRIKLFYSIPTIAIFYPRTSRARHGSAREMS